MSYVILDDHFEDSDAWHEARRSSLGASEVAAVLGLSKWQTPLSVYRAKMGIRNTIPEDLAYFGHKMEPVIAGWISDKRPEVGTILGGLSVQSPQWWWLTATPDRTVIDSNGMVIPVELKTSSAYSKDQWRDGVPDYYRIQSLVQQGILGAQYGWLAVLHGGNEPELYKIPFDTEVWEQITRLTGQWWQTHVVAKIAPEPTTTEEAVELWPGDPEITIEGDESLLELWGAYGLMQAEQMEISEQLEKTKLTLQKAMQDAVALTYNGRELFTWRPRKGATRLDSKALKADRPDVYETYMRAGENTRTFLRKGASND